MDDHYACPSCGHCADAHSFYGGYCDWKSPNGIVCPCVLDPSQARVGYVERWPEEEEVPA